MPQSSPGFRCFFDPLDPLDALDALLDSLEALPWTSPRRDVDGTNGDSRVTVPTERKKTGSAPPKKKAQVDEISRNKFP